MKRIPLFLLLFVLQIFCLESVAKNLPRRNVYVLYDNDVHCAVDGYARFAALRNEFRERSDYVATVSSGDFIQGGIVGSATKGMAIVDIMNAVGYDYVTLGNHEFDYGVGTTRAIARRLKAKVVDANFCSYPSMKPLYEPYVIARYGDVKVAYVGLTTPNTPMSCSPLTFLDAEEKNYVYGFMGDSLVTYTQRQVDKAKAEGADYVVLLAHLGDYVTGQNGITSVRLIGGTNGIDAVLDGHCHSVIEDSLVMNKDGLPVHLTSTGTKFEYMGVMTLDTLGNIATRLVRSKDYKNVDDKVARVVEKKKNELAKKGRKLVGRSEVDMEYASAADGIYVRRQETTLGNFFADAYRDYCGTDIAVVNGGGLRESIHKGALTLNDIFAVTPFNNSLVSGEITGQQLLDALEVAVSMLPQDDGIFLQVSGMRFKVDTMVVADIMHNGLGMFCGIAEGSPRRVSGLQVMDRETGEFVAVEKDRIYTICSNSYVMRDLGIEGAFGGVRNLQQRNSDEIIPVLEYIKGKLNGVIPKRYSATDGRIIIKGNE